MNSTNVHHGSIKIAFSDLSRVNNSNITENMFSVICDSTMNLQYIINVGKSFSGMAWCGDGSDQSKMAHVHLPKRHQEVFYGTAWHRFTSL